MGKTFISFGRNTFCSSEFKKIQNNKSKPSYGFWACTFTPDKKYYSEWDLQQFLIQIVI